MALLWRSSIVEESLRRAVSAGPVRKPCVGGGRPAFVPGAVEYVKPLVHPVAGLHNDIAAVLEQPSPGVAQADPLRARARKSW
ncbi:hypothetical protein GCM10009646_63340 [Streptomyces aureus]